MRDDGGTPGAPRGFHCTAWNPQRPRRPNGSDGRGLRTIETVSYCAPIRRDSSNVPLIFAFGPGLTADGALPSVLYMPIGVFCGGGPELPS